MKDCLQCAWCAAFGEWLPHDKKMAILELPIHWTCVIRVMQMEDMAKMMKLVRQ